MAVGDEYALISSITDELRETSRHNDDTAQTKAPWIWVPVIRNPAPAVTASQVAEAANGSVAGNYVFGWSVRSKTKAELDADAVASDERKTAQIDSNVNAMLGRALFKIVNEIRVLQTQPVFTPAQFKTWFKNQQQ